MVSLKIRVGCGDVALMVKYIRLGPGALVPQNKQEVRYVSLRAGFQTT